MQEFSVRKFIKGEVVFKEGSVGNSAYILKAGRIEISTGANSKKMVISVLKPLSIFGEMAVLSKDHRRTATAVAAENAEVVEIDKLSFDEYLRGVPPVIMSILEGLVERLKETTKRIVPSSFDLFISTCRILNLLTTTGGKEEVPYEETAVQVAQILATDVIRIKEKLSRLENLGLIKLKDDSMGGKTIVIVDRSAFLDKASRIQQEQGWQF